MAKRLTAGEREAVQRVLTLAVSCRGRGEQLAPSSEDRLAIEVVKQLLAQQKPVGRPRTRAHDDNNPKCSCVDCRKRRKDPECQACGHKRSDHVVDDSEFTKCFNTGHGSTYCQCPGFTKEEKS